MLWQAEAGMRFCLLGGYALGPGARRVATYTYLPPRFGSVIATLVTDQAGTLPPALLIPASPPATPFDVRRFVREEGVDTVVAARDAPGAAKAIALFGSALGQPEYLRDVDVWHLHPGATPPGTPGPVTPDPFPAPPEGAHLAMAPR